MPESIRHPVEDGKGTRWIGVDEGLGEPRGDGVRNRKTRRCKPYVSPMLDHEPPA